MLSVDRPSELSCSGKAVALEGDDGAHPTEGLVLLEADPAAGFGEVQRSHFSIREYAFSSRSKDIRTNWPFPQHYLRLCLKHGVRDLLPPFEPPHLVRARCRENLEPAQVLFSEIKTQGGVDPVENNCVDPLDGESGAAKFNSNLLTHEVILSSFNRAQTLSSEDKSAVAQEVSSDDEPIYRESEVISKVTRHDRAGSSLSAATELPLSLQGTRIVLSAVEVAKPPPSSDKVEGLHKSSEKKCKLTVKLGGTAEHNQNENIVSNCGLVSDPMTSKVCPVCKTFSSSSNTTLNAHIDQCLCVESNSKQLANKFSKHNVKPRKKRSMVDICATAPSCTLEDLDRRNGTNWALDLTLVVPTNENSCTTESKRPRISTLDLVKNKSEGAIYVDSKGTKHRILSTSKDTALVDGSNLKEFRKQVKDEKNVSSGKKKHLSAKYKKFLKFKIQSKQINSKQLKGKIHKSVEMRFHEDTYQGEEITSHTSTSQDQIKGQEPGIMGQWVCSRRSGLSKNINNIGNRKPRNSLARSHCTIVKGDHSVIGNSYATRNGRTFVTSSDNFTSPLKTKSIDNLSNTVFETDDCGEHAAVTPKKCARSVGKYLPACNGLMLKLPRSSGSNVSSARAKRMNGNVVQRAHKFQSTTKVTSEICHPPVQKAKRNSRTLLVEKSSCPMEAIKCTQVLKSGVSKRLRRCPVEKMGKYGKKLLTELREGCRGSQALNNIGSVCNNETNGTCTSSNKFWRSENRDSIGQVSTGSSNRMDCGEDKVDYHLLDVGECIALKQMQMSHTVVTQDIPVDTTNFKLMTKSLLEKAIVSHSSGEDVTTECHGAASCDRLEMCSLEDPKEASGEEEPIIVASFPRLVGDRGMHYGVIAGDEIISKDIQMVGQLELSVKDHSCLEPQNLQYKTDAAFGQGLSTCLTGPRDTSFEVHDDSLVTFGRTATAQDHNIVIDGESSGSPLSSTSTVSHSSMEDFKFKNLELETSEEPVEIQEKVRSGCSSDMVLLHNGRIRGAEGTNLEKRIQKVKPYAAAEQTNAAARQTEKPWDGQSCCCSERESCSRESQLSRQSVTTEMVLSTKSKHMTSGVYIRPVISSFDACSTFRAEALAVPILESPTDTISTKASEFHNNFRLASSSGSTQCQSVSIPILRLMGKDLMVTNTEERVQHQNLAIPCSMDTSNSRWHSSNNQPCATLDQMDCSLGSTLQNGMMAKGNTEVHQRSGEKWSSSVYSLEKGCLPRQRKNHINFSEAPIKETEIIVIDDSRELEGESSESLPSPASTLAPTFSHSLLGPGRTFSYFPSQNPFQSSEMGCGLKSGFPVSWSGANADSTNGGSTSETSGPLLPRPLVTPSPSAGHLASELYCYPSLW